MAEAHASCNCGLPTTEYPTNPSTTVHYDLDKTRPANRVNPDQPICPAIYQSPVVRCPLSIMNGQGDVDVDVERRDAIDNYKSSLLELREWEAKLKELRMGIKDLQREFDVSEDNIKALQSVGQIIGEVLKQLDEERCKLP